MFKRRTTFVALALSAGALAAATVSALPRPQEMSQAGAQHEMLLEGVGTWKGTMTSFMPGMPPTETPAQEVVEAVGDLWTQSRFECEFMGMAFAGAGCLGYDTEQGKYVGTWIDNMTTRITLMEGDYDEASKTLTMQWKGPDMTGQLVDQSSKTVREGDSYTSTFFMGVGEGATKTMVIAMKREAAPVEAGAGR